MTDDRQQRAIERMAMRGPDEVVMSFEGQINAGGQRRVTHDGKVYYDPAPITEYPRLLYRKTDEEDRDYQTDKNAKCGETYLVRNNYGTAKQPLLCETRIANDLSEAEELTADGWEISPQAAYGISDGLAKVTSAKDDRIAELEAQLAASQKRGPGRPPKQPDDIAADNA